MDSDRARFSVHGLSVTMDGARLTDAHYNGVDDHGRPYTVTAATANQRDVDRVDLTSPNGDITLGHFEGLYCVPCEAYYTKKELIDETLCPVHKKKASRVRVHFDQRGGADLQYDSCCEKLGAHIGATLG